MPRDLGVVCEDAGAAQALAPVLAALLARGDRVHLVLGPVADAVLRAQPDLSSALAHARRAVVSEESAVGPALEALPWSAMGVMLTGSTCWGTRMEARAVLRAKRERVPAVTLLDFWSNYRARLSYPTADDMSVVPDRLLAVDSYMEDDLRTAGVPPSRVVVTGSPAYERLLAMKLPLPSDTRRVLFLSQPLSAMYPRCVETLGYSEETVLHAVARVLAPLGAALRVRPHPREDRAALRALCETLEGDAELDEAPSLHTSLASVRMVLGMTTAALIEAAMLGRVAVSVQLHARGEDPLPSNRSGLTMRADTEAHLRETILREWLNADPQPAQHTWAIRMADSTARVMVQLDSETRG